MAFRITFEDLDAREEAQHLWRACAPRFRVWSGDEPLRVVRVELSALLAQQLLGELRATQDFTTEVVTEGRLLGVLLRFAVRQLDQQLRAGVLPATSGVEVHLLRVEEGDLALLASMLGAKTCDYQLRDGRDLLCSAATPNDQTQVGVLGWRTVAPTSMVACLACALPDTDYLCSRLLHPHIIGARTMGGPFPARTLGQCACDIGRQEVREPDKCCAGGHGCWTWIVEPELEAVTIPAENMLGEAFDFLSAVWELHFGRPLLRLRSVASTVGSRSRAGTASEFDSAMSALDDTLKLLEISDELLPAEQRGIPKQHTFKRLQACLQAGLDEAGAARLQRALGVYMATNNIRVAAQHGGTKRSLPEAFERLGLRFTASWPDIWGGVQAKVIEALGVLRAIVDAKGPPRSFQRKSNDSAGAGGVCGQLAGAGGATRCRVR
jgi:hypothetical protein